MRNFAQLVLLTFVRGAMFLVPVVLLMVVARETYQILRRVFEPPARLIPVDRFVGVLLEDLLTIVAIALVFLAAGLFVGTRPGQRLSDRLERQILYRVPGYFLVRGAVGIVPGLDSETNPAPVLVETDDGWAFALLIERSPPGFCTVYLPDAPSPTSGSVRIVTATRVRPLEAPMLGLLGCLTRSGAGAGALTQHILDPELPRTK